MFIHTIDLTNSIHSWRLKKLHVLDIYIYTVVLVQGEG